MTIAFTLFMVSMVGIGGMIASKIFEVKVRKIHFLSNLFIRGDEKIHQLIQLATLKYNRYRQVAHIFVFEFLPSYLFELLVKMKDYVSKKYYSVGNEFRGKRVLKSNGAVSFFLERLAEDKHIEKKS